MMTLGFWFTLAAFMLSIVNFYFVHTEHGNKGVCHFTSWVLIAFTGIASLLVGLGS